jgi:archaeal flagellar protein FlaJ
MDTKWARKYMFWVKKKGSEAAQKDQSYDPQLLSMDFYCQLVYMSAISTAGIARDKLVYYAARLPFIAARFFRKVDFVAKMFNHDYPQACRIVGEKTNEPEVKALLLRLSSALASGEDVSSFLNRESQIYGDAYGNSYERRIDLLKKWGDAYVSLIMTTALVTVMCVIAMMIGNVTISFMVSLSVVTIVASFLGTWFLYKTAPREVRNHVLSSRSKEQELARALAKILLPTGLAAVIVMIATGMGLGVILITIGIFLFPIGLVAVIDDGKICKRDTEVATFIRSLGGVMQAIGATASEAMSRLEFRSLGSMKESVELLYSRILAGITLRNCWDRFVGESGSEQVNRSVRIFWDGISFGGDPQKVGNEASSFAMRIAFLRAQRSQMATGFTWLTIAMHAVLATLSVFIYAIFLNFSSLVNTILPKTDDTGALPSLPSFGLFSQSASYLNLLHFMVIAVVLILTVANALSIHFVNGGHFFKMLFYGALTAIISGGVFLVVPQIVNVIFTPNGEIKEAWYEPELGCQLSWFFSGDLLSRFGGGSSGISLFLATGGSDRITQSRNQTGKISINKSRQNS